MASPLESAAAFQPTQRPARQLNAEKQRYLDLVRLLTRATLKTQDVLWRRAASECTHLELVELVGASGSPAWSPMVLANVTDVPKAVLLRSHGAPWDHTFMDSAAARGIVALLDYGKENCAPVEDSIFAAAIRGGPKSVRWLLDNHHEAKWPPCARVAAIESGCFQPVFKLVAYVTEPLPTADVTSALERAVSKGVLVEPELVAALRRIHWDRWDFHISLYALRLIELEELRAIFDVSQDARALEVCKATVARGEVAKAWELKDVLDVSETLLILKCLQDGAPVPGDAGARILAVVTEENLDLATIGHNSMLQMLEHLAPQNERAPDFIAELVRRGDTSLLAIAPEFVQNTIFIKAITTPHQHHQILTWFVAGYGNGESARITTGVQKSPAFREWLGRNGHVGLLHDL